jgi:hypothetical protein
MRLVLTPGPSKRVDAVDPTVVEVAAGPLAAPVLARVTAAVAAQANLTLDRVNDAGLIVESLAAHSVRHLPDGLVRMAFTAMPGRLEIRFGPLEPGGARAVLDEAALPGLGPVLDRLSDDIRLESHGEADHLTISLIQSRST